MTTITERQKIAVRSKNTRLPERVTLIGLGLMGSSIAYALADSWAKCGGRLGQPVMLHGIDPDSITQSLAAKSGLFTSVSADINSGINNGALDVDLIIVATPLLFIENIFQSISSLFRPEQETVVTDVAGVKSLVHNWAQRCFQRGIFVGSHPMSGGVQGGFTHGRGDLFQGATVAVCPTGESAKENTSLQMVKAFWHHLGAQPIIYTAEEHDKIVAVTSHLPYLSAIAQRFLVEFIEDSRLSGRGFKAATRQADFSPEVMASVVNANPTLPVKVREMAQVLLHMADLMERDREGDRGHHRGRELIDFCVARHALDN